MANENVKPTRMELLNTVAPGEASPWPALGLAPSR